MMCGGTVALGSKIRPRADGIHTKENGSYEVMIIKAAICDSVHRCDRQPSRCCAISETHARQGRNGRNAQSCSCSVQGTF